MIFLVGEKEKKNLGWVFLVNVAGVGLSQGRVCRGVGLSQGCVCRWGAFVAGVGLSWGGFVVGWVCRGEGLSRGGFVWGGFVGVPVPRYLVHLLLEICLQC